MTYDYKKVYNTLDDGKVAEKFPAFHHLEGHLTQAEDKYPKLNVTIDPKQLNNLIDENGLLSFTQMKTPVEKLLYAFLWKQGDLSKVRHIIEGITGSTLLKDKRSGMVFHQFGKHLSDNEEPIIDINVLRAFAVYTDTQGGLTKSGISQSPEGAKLVEAYIQWFKKVANTPERRFMIDRIMFAIGKHIKKNPS
jgi:hypothetical protein